VADRLKARVPGKAVHFHIGGRESRRGNACIGDPCVLRGLGGGFETTCIDTDCPEVVHCPHSWAVFLGTSLDMEVPTMHLTIRQRLVVLCLALVLLAALLVACGDNPETPTQQPSSPLPTQPTSPTQPPSPLASPTSATSTLPPATSTPCG